MKKQLSAMLALILSFALLTVPPVFADETNYIYDSFNGETKLNWTPTGISGNDSYGLIGEPSAQNQSYHVRKAPDTVQTASPRVTGKLPKAISSDTVIVDFRMRTDFDMGAGYFIMYLSDDTATTHAGVLEIGYGNTSTLATYPTGFVTTRNGTARTQLSDKSIMPVDTNRWYHYRFVFNLVDGTYTLQVDNYTYPATLNMFAKVNNIGSIFMNTSNTARRGSFYIDDLKIYAGDDASSAAITKECLTLEQTEVESSFTLPVTGENGAQISWSTQDDAITINGANAQVTQPSYLEGSRDVELTAAITKGEATEEKKFTVTVLPRPMTDEEAVALDAEPLICPETLMQDLELPTAGENGSAISWSSSNESAIEITDREGKTYAVAHRLTTDQTAVLTATVTKNAASKTKEFTITVPLEFTDAMAVQSDSEAIDLGDLSAVTQPLTLPTAGENNTSIAWKTSDETVLAIETSEDGALTTRATQQADDRSITLTATVTRGQESVQRTFTVTVPGNPAIYQGYLDEIINGLNISNTLLMDDITLPSSVGHGFTITWQSSDTSVLSNSGAVTRPTGSDRAVVLTATVQNGTLSGTKSFRLTVLGRNSGGSSSGGGGGSRRSGGTTYITKENPTFNEEPTNDNPISFVDAPPLGVVLNGIRLEFDQEPIIENDRVLVPLRKIAEALGAEVVWNAADRSVTVIRQDKTVFLTIDSMDATIGEETITMDVAPKIVNDRTLVPVRFLSEGLGVQSVDWDAVNRTVKIIEIA